MNKLLFNKTFTIGNTDERKALSDELYEKFGKEIKYPLIRKLINDKGVQFIREETIKLEKEGNLNWKLLCWIANQTKIIWK